MALFPMVYKTPFSKFPSRYDTAVCRQFEPFNHRHGYFEAPKELSNLVHKGNLLPVPQDQPSPMSGIGSHPEWVVVPVGGDYMGGGRIVPDRCYRLPRGGKDPYI
jgi:hypothetical protein